MFRRNLCWKEKVLCLEEKCNTHRRAQTHDHKVKGYDLINSKENDILINEGLTILGIIKFGQLVKSVA